MFVTSKIYSILPIYLFAVYLCLLQPVSSVTGEGIDFLDRQHVSPVLYGI